jgi:hypothetical protein
MLSKRFLQQIQGGQQIEFNKNEIERANRVSQPQVPFLNKLNPESQSAGLPESAGNPNHEHNLSTPICWPS